jgi:hypothetical protein
VQVGVDSNINKWDQPFVLGVVDPHDSLSHPAGVSDVQAESATCLDPDLFTNFLVCNYMLPFSDCLSQFQRHVDLVKILAACTEQISAFHLLAYDNLLYTLCVQCNVDMCDVASNQMTNRPLGLTSCTWSEA